MQDIETPDEKGPLGWPAGQAPSDINDAARALMALLSARADSADPVRGYPELLRARCSVATRALVDAAARMHGMTQSEYVRQAAMTALQLDGFDPAPIAPRDAGSLYNVIAGQRSYALVSGDRVLTSTARIDAKPDLADGNHHPAGYALSEGDRWVPIEYADSEPFDPDRHYRLAPVTRIEADRVVRVYPVIPRECA